MESAQANKSKKEQASKAVLTCANSCTGETNATDKALQPAGPWQCKGPLGHSSAKLWLKIITHCCRPLAARSKLPATLSQLLPVELVCGADVGQQLC